MAMVTADMTETETGAEIFLPTTGGENPVLLSTEMISMTGEMIEDMIGEMIEVIREEMIDQGEGTVTAESLMTGPNLWLGMRGWRRNCFLEHQVASILTSMRISQSRPLVQMCHRELSHLIK